jgi:hypothetical protein
MVGVRLGHVRHRTARSALKLRNELAGIVDVSAGAGAVVSVVAEGGLGEGVGGTAFVLRLFREPTPRADIAYCAAAVESRSDGSM